MTASNAAQDQIAALIADVMPEKIMAFKFAPTIQRRIAVLVQHKKEGNLVGLEKEELEKYLMYDLLIGLAKARAIRRIKPL
jgi:hypothetical protein